MNSWDLMALDLKPRLPEILSSTGEERAIALDIAAGDCLSEHEVQERTWVLVPDGALEFTTASGEGTSGGAGPLIEFAPGERHEVLASSDARLLLPLNPVRQRPFRRGGNPRQAQCASYHQVRVVSAVPRRRHTGGAPQRRRARLGPTPGTSCFIRLANTINETAAAPAAVHSCGAAPAPGSASSRQRAAGR